MKATEGDGAQPTDHSPADDLQTIRLILAGSTEAWHAFVLRYAGLILSVLRRYLFDEDEVRDAFVETLERLRGGKLAVFEGRSTLSTWLVIVTRNVARDALRVRFGRKALPKGLRRLDRRTRDVFRLYYIEGLSFDAVRHWVTRGEAPMEGEELLCILRRIELEVDDRVLRRIAYDLAAASLGDLSGRQLEFLDECRSEFEEARRTWSPEHDLLCQEAERVASEVRRALEELPPEERRVLELRFGRGWTARRVAKELGLDREQRAFTMARRALRQLRSRLKGEDTTDPMFGA